MDQNTRHEFVPRKDGKPYCDAIIARDTCRLIAKVYCGARLDDTIHDLSRDVLERECSPAAKRKK